MLQRRVLCIPHCPPLYFMSSSSIFPIYLYGNVSHVAGREENILWSKSMFSVRPVLPMNSRNRICPLPFSPVTITLTSHERHGVANGQQLDCWLTRLFRLHVTRKNTLKPRITKPLLETIGDWWISQPAQRKGQYWCESVSKSWNHYVRKQDYSSGTDSF